MAAEGQTCRVCWTFPRCIRALSAVCDGRSNRRQRPTVAGFPPGTRLAVA